MKYSYFSLTIISYKTFGLFIIINRSNKASNNEVDLCSNQHHKQEHLSLLSKLIGSKGNEKVNCFKIGVLGKIYFSLLMVLEKNLPLLPSPYREML